MLYSLVVAWFAEFGHKKAKFPDRPWYIKKSTASFVDMLATLRRESLREFLSEDPSLSRGRRKMMRRFDETLGMAAGTCVGMPSKTAKLELRAISVGRRPPRCVAALPILIPDGAPLRERLLEPRISDGSDAPW